MSKTWVDQASRLGQIVGGVLFGGKSFPISQDFAELNDWTKSSGMYGYASQYGFPDGTHIGVDIAAPYGTDVHSISEGDVTSVGWTGFFRPYPVTVTDKDGTELIYGHMSRDDVVVGQHVKPGDQLGLSGEQDPTSGAHIHLEVRKDGKAVDPLDYLSGTSTASPLSAGTGSGSKGGDRKSTADVQKFMASAVVIVLGGGLLIIGVAGLFPEETKKLMGAAKIAAVA